MLVSAQQYNILASYSYHIHNKQLTQIMSCHVILLDNAADDDYELLYRPESLDLPTIEPFIMLIYVFFVCISSFPFYVFCVSLD